MGFCNTTILNGSVLLPQYAKNISEMLIVLTKKWWMAGSIYNQVFFVIKGES